MGGVSEENGVPKFGTRARFGRTGITEVAESRREDGKLESNESVSDALRRDRPRNKVRWRTTETGRVFSLAGYRGYAVNINRTAYTPCTGGRSGNVRFR